MSNRARLFWFELAHGNSVAIKILRQQYGVWGAVELVARMQLRLMFNNPFKALNARQKPTANEKLSQHQMAPLVVLYLLLKEKGIAGQEALANLSEVSNAVAIEFLRFNVPVIRKDQYASLSTEAKYLQLEKMTARFFNAEAVLQLDENDSFSFNVQRCHFAHYSKLLGLAELAPLFCDADKRFFESHQPDVVFFRSQTLASHQLPCDFKFSWRNSTAEQVVK